MANTTITNLNLRMPTSNVGSFHPRHCRVEVIINHRKAKAQIRRETGLILKNLIDQTTLIKIVKAVKFNTENIRVWI